MIISPTYLGSHNYPRYEEMAEVLESYLFAEKEVVIDFDFMFQQEVDSYIRDILIPTYSDNKEVIVWLQTKQKDRIKRIARILNSVLQKFSPIIQEEGFYKIKLL